MQISKQLQVKIRDSIREKILDTDELRRVEGVGEMYISRATDQQRPGFDVMFTVLVDSAEYRLQRRSGPLSIN